MKESIGSVRFLFLLWAALSLGGVAMYFISPFAGGLGWLTIKLLLVLGYLYFGVTLSKQLEAGRSKLIKAFLLIGYVLQLVAWLIENNPGAFVGMFVIETLITWYLYRNVTRLSSMTLPEAVLADKRLSKRFYILIVLFAILMLAIFVGGAYIKKNQPQGVGSSVPGLPAHYS